MVNSRKNVCLSKEAIEIVNKHFPNNFSAGLERMIRKFDRDELTFNEIKFYIRKVKDSKNV